MLNTLENLFSLARDRKKSPKEGSYTNKLLNDKSLSKTNSGPVFRVLLDRVLNETDNLITRASTLPSLLKSRRLAMEVQAIINIANCLSKLNEVD